MDNRCEEIKNNPVLKELFKKFCRYGWKDSFQEKYPQISQLCEELEQKGEMPSSPSWIQSPESVDPETFNSMSEMEKTLCIDKISSICKADMEAGIESQLSCATRSFFVNYTLGNKDVFEVIRYVPKFFEGVSVSCIEKLSILDLEKILKRMSKKDEAEERYVFANQMKLIMQQNPDSPLARDHLRMQWLDRYASQGRRHRTSYSH